MGRFSCFSPAIILRSAALFIILFQLRLLAGNLADTPIFAAFLLTGFIAAAFLSFLRLNNKPVNHLSALIVICLIPWVTRALVAMPRFFAAGRTDSAAITFDSILLNLDRNNFVSLFPYYWSAVSTWFAVRSYSGKRKFLRAAVIADTVILLIIYSIARTSQIELYRWPIITIILFSVMVFLQALSLLFSMPRQTKLRIKEKCFAAAALLAIISAGGFFFLKPFQEKAVEMGGGLLEPKLFNLDFSKYLKLDSEISMKNELVLIVKKDDTFHHLIRRSVLSGYNSKQGFFKNEELDDKNHPQRLPAQQVFLTPGEFESSIPVDQEYFLVNVDESAFIGMKEPAVISPYESWDSSSFNSAYAVESYVSGADYWDLMFVTLRDEQPSLDDLGLSESEYKIYTEYGNNEKLRSLAEEITAGCSRYADKIYTIYDYLKYGDYRYSLKPGIAPDGDQLGWFLFQSKKGYCSYYAFSMTLLLRSLGIPARVASGFFVDPDSGTFDYYPVRSYMAHAWVEVAFPKYGWIEFDPTTENLAEDEEFQFTAGTDTALFEKLMKEIFENRSRMKIKESTEDSSSESGFDSFTHNVVSLIKSSWLPLLAVVLATVFFSIRCGIYFSVFTTQNQRKKSVRLMKHACRRLRLAGFRRNGPSHTSEISEPEWALQLEDRFKGIYSLYQSAAAARFAPEYSKTDFELQQTNYAVFSLSYKKKVSVWRRIIAWLFPPLAIMAGPGKRSGKTLLLFFILCLMAGSWGKAQEDEYPYDDNADELYEQAVNAVYAENWEKAIKLYMEGKEHYPNDVRFPWALGSLYYNRSLYGLAWDEYRKAEVIFPDDPELLTCLAETAGLLNKDLLSVEYFERVLEHDPDNLSTISSLSWMYFKVHRLADGEKLLVSSLERFGEDAHFSMTLGTIYSDMYRYDDGKHWYKKAITIGENYGDHNFTSIAWYNLSILESRFFRYDLCMDATNFSLNAQNRASGRLARGELYTQQLELEKARKDYEAAYETDTSPLAKLSLAQVYQKSGRLEEARLYAEDCLKRSDYSWMMNYGIDPDRYKRDIHLILAKTYLGLAETECLLPWEKLPEKISSVLRTISYKFKHEVNIKLYRKYCLAAAKAYGNETYNGGGQHLNSILQYYSAFEDYPKRAITYLNAARSFETSLIPAAEPTYNYEEGYLTGNEALVEKALYGFDPLWEKESISICYSELANPKKAGFFSSRGRNRNETAEELYALNRGALRQAGIKLPVRINLELTQETAAYGKMIEKTLSRSGFIKDETNLNARFTLNIKINNTQAGNSSAAATALCELTDNFGEMAALRRTIPLQALTNDDICRFTRTLGNAVFTVE
jgi:tetratricopeptide (TPR) repeat protein